MPTRLDILRFLTAQDNINAYINSVDGMREYVCVMNVLGILSLIILTLVARAAIKWCVELVQLLLEERRKKRLVCDSVDES